MDGEKFVEKFPFGRPGIYLVRREGDDYWQMMNSDGDVWGKFYSYDKDMPYPYIYRTYQLSEGKRPFRVYHDDFMLKGNKYVDTNGYFSDDVYHEDSGYYRDSNVEFVKLRFRSWYWAVRDCDGNYGKRVFGYESYGDRSLREKIDGIYYDYCFEKDGKIKLLYDLKAIDTGDNGVQLLKEDESRPITRCIKYGAYIPKPLYFFKDKNGELSESFYEACKYTNGWAKVQKHYYDRDIHYRDEKGNLSIPFLEGTEYFKGYAVVKIDEKKYCLRDTEGNLSTKWFKSEYGALEEIKAGNAKKYFEKRTLDTTVDEEQLKSYYYIGIKDKYGFMPVQKYIGGDYQFVDKDGNLSEPFYAHFYTQSIQKFWNSGHQVRDLESGNLSQEVYFVVNGYDSTGCAAVQLKPNGPYYLMDKDGNMSEPFAEIHREHNGFRAVKKSFFHPYQIIDKNWNLSQKKYPDKDSIDEEIRKNDFKFEKENEPSIKPRPKKRLDYKKTEQNTGDTSKEEIALGEGTKLISAMIDSNINAENVAAKGKETSQQQVAPSSTKSALERYLSNEISVYQLEPKHFKGETLEQIIRHEKNNYLQAVMYFDSEEKKAEIRKDALEIAEYIKSVAYEVHENKTKTIDYIKQPIF